MTSAYGTAVTALWIARLDTLVLILFPFMFLAGLAAYVLFLDPVSEPHSLLWLPLDGMEAERL